MRTLVALLLLVAATAAHADHDPEPRTNLELGFEASLRGNAPLGGYAFLHWNRPHFAEEDLYLRVDVAPVYLDTELISDGWPWKGHAIGLGARGGLFASNFDEFRNGEHKERESFWGHDAGLSLTYYRHRLIAYTLPIEAQIRFRPEYVIYQRSGDARGEILNWPSQDDPGAAEPVNDRGRGAFTTEETTMGSLRPPGGPDRGLRSRVGRVSGIAL